MLFIKTTNPSRRTLRIGNGCILTGGLSTAKRNVAQVQNDGEDAENLIQDVRLKVQVFKRILRRVNKN